MSSHTEACPFCGKAFKRLKTHLPHCKMAPVTKVTQSSKTPPATPNAITSKKSETTLSSSSSLLSATTANKSKMTSSPSLSSLLSSSSSSSTIPTTKTSENTPSSSSQTTPTTKKKKKKKQQQLPDETQIVASSSSPSLSRPKKKSPLGEGDLSKPVSGRLKGTRAPSLGLLSTALSLGTDPLSPRAPVLTGGQSSPITANSEPNTTPTTANTKPKAAPRKKGPQREKAESSAQTPKANTVSQDSLQGVLREEGLHGIGGEIGARPNGRIQFWAEVEMEGSRIDLLRKEVRGEEKVQWSGSGQTNPILQDHTSTTDHKPERLCNNTGVRDHIQTSATDQSTDSLYSKTRTRGPITVDLSQTSTPAFSHNGQTGNLLAPAANLAQSPYTSPQTDKLSLTKKWVHNRSLKPSLPSSLAAAPSLTNPKPPSGLPYQSQGRGSPQLNPPPSLSPSVSPPPHPSSVARVTPLRTVVSSEEVSQLMGRFTTSPYTPTEHVRREALPHVSPYFPPSVLPSLSPPTLAVGAGTVKANQSLTPLKTRTHSTAEQQIVGAVAERTLGGVRLKELPDWLAQRVPSKPREGVEMLHRGWQWYYKRYIDVKRGGVGGVAMLLAGYCVLSYMWSYPHLKRDRWRKYH